MLMGADDLNGAVRQRTALLGNGNFLPSRKIIGGDRSFHFHQFFRGTAGHDASAVNAGGGADIDDVIRGQHRIFIVFYNDDRVADIPKVVERFNELGVIPLMKADAGFVQNIENPHQRGTDLSRQANPLGLAAGKRSAAAGEGHVIEPHIL